MIGREKDAPGIGREEGRKVCAAQIGHLPHVAAVGIGDKNLELARANQPLPEQPLVVRERFSRRARRPPDDL